MPTPNECLRCRGTMEQGFLMDMRHHDSKVVAKWVEGAPVKSFWSGLHTKGRREIPVTAYRCTQCGWLEMSARAD